MEKTTQFHLTSSIPGNPFISKTRTRPISPLHGFAETSIEKLSSNSSSLILSPYSPTFEEPMRLTSLSSAKQTHARVLKSADWSSSISSSNNLIAMYRQVGDFRSASIVFFTSLETKRNSVSPISWVKELDEAGIVLSQLLEVFKAFHSKGMIHNSNLLTLVLMICSDSLDFWLGVQVHACALKKGLDLDVHLRNTLIDFYVGSCRRPSEEQLLNEIALRNVHFWNETIMLNGESGMWLKCLQLFQVMQVSCVEVNNITITKILQACGKLEALKEGKQIHGYAVKSALILHLLVRNSLISMYAKCSELGLARTVFESINNRSLVTWNSMISGYASNGFLNEAWDLYNKMGLSEMRPDLVTWNSLIAGLSLHGSLDGIMEVIKRMQIAGFQPNSSSITSTLQAISQMGSLEMGKEIHGYVIRNCLDGDIYIGTSLVDMYIKKGTLTKARSVYNNMKSRNIFVWNSLISGYVYAGLMDEALELLSEMGKEGIQPDLVTWNSLVSGYAMQGLNRRALLLIHQLKTIGWNPNVVSWTALISGCSQKGNYLDSLRFSVHMQKAGIRPNSSTIASLLRACAGLAFLEKGLELHSFAIKYDFDSDIFVATALVDMYSKSGRLLYAHRVFRKISNKNLASWNAMLMGFAMHGQGERAMSLFNEMCEVGTKPDGISFTALLTACRHSGLIDEGWKYFDNMKSYSLKPTLEHYACMVDLLGQGGYLDEAWDLIRAMKLEPDATVWGALLAACRVHKNVALAEISAKYLFKLEPNNFGNYLMMMNLYAAEGRSEDVEILKDLMSITGVTKRPGWSWVQIDHSVHVFSVEGRPHPDMGEIYFELYQMFVEMKKLGYVPDTDCVTEEMDEEDKERILLSHTEKLAITYGLIRTGKTVTVRVIKNTSVCRDCHSAAKYMSQVTGREIVLRDGVRFHHFVNGKCSCSN